MTKRFKTKKDFHPQDLKRIKKKLVIFWIGLPIVLPLALLEGKISFNQSFRVSFIEFADNLFQMTKMVLGGKAYNNSKAIKEYELKLKSKKNKIDFDVALKMVNTFGSMWSYFDRNEISYRLNTEAGEIDCIVQQHGKDKFTFSYYDYGYYTTSKKNINSKYLLTKEQVLELLDYYQK